MLTILAGLVFLFAVFDEWLTERRITKYGVNVELNAAIRWLCQKLGIGLGVAVGIIIPTLALLYLALIFHLTTFLAFLVGFRFRLFMIQCESIVFEKQIKKFAAEINAASSGPHQPSLPGSSAPSSASERK